MNGRALKDTANQITIKMCPLYLLLTRPLWVLAKLCTVLYRTITCQWMVIDLQSRARMKLWSGDDMMEGVDEPEGFQDWCYSTVLGLPRWVPTGGLVSSFIGSRWLVEFSTPFELRLWEKRIIRPVHLFFFLSLSLCGKKQRLLVSTWLL